MTKHNANNERLKRRYLIFLKEAMRQHEQTLDLVAAALARFEASTGYRDFRLFRPEMAVAFKRRLAEQEGPGHERQLSKATVYAMLGHLKRFFRWVAGQPTYKSRISYSDAEYFNLSDKESRIATARRERPFPTIEQVRHVVATMPAGSDVERRNRALIAFTLLTGARDSAIASMKLKHVDLIEGKVYQDAREVNTKFSKSITTFFFPVGDDILQIVVDWVTFLRQQRLWGNDDPLFPPTVVMVGKAQRFQAGGFRKTHWTNASAIRGIFRAAFTSAGLPYFQPHSFRNTLVQLGESRCANAEEFKAWSQNLGHEGVLTTFRSYGAVGTGRQAEIIRRLGAPAATASDIADEVVAAVIQKLRGSGR